TAFPIAREALQREIGDAALVDAAGVLAIYDAVVKIADATGIPLEEAKAEMSADFRDDLGINDYPSAAGRI
ncbi:MAG: alkylhydroperoxidase-related (seleno)protein, partial [Rhodospirillaceae bacterium]|nr:alkylhydroperoxidase-related (seleno)protein [Rhodospirillaceae bacterium]